MHIMDLNPEDKQLIEQVAILVVEGFREHHPESWPNKEEALAEIEESFGAERISRIAINEKGMALGWIGGIRQYNGHVWELHPLVVKPEEQRRGIGRMLINDLEEQVKARGGLTISLGTDDESNQTSLSGINLYPNVLEHAAGIKNLRGHAYEFYQKLGFVIIGVLPDANGPGKPDIYMAKPVSI
jgi:aminoglycoside 6'-N-acetyltransferase I